MTALAWRSALDERDTADVLALLDAATSEDGTAPVSEHVLLCLRRGGNPGARHLLARADPADSADGRDSLAGYAHLDLTDPVAAGSGELAVHPASRRRGVGTALVTELLARMADPGDGSPGGVEQGTCRPLRLWAHGDHPGAVRLAETMGFQRVRTLWQMRRSLLEPLPEAGLPEGVRLRPFVVGQDEPAFLRVNNAAFDWHPEQGGWDVEQVKLREAEPWFDPEGFLLAVQERTADGAAASERLLGFHWTKVHGATVGGDPEHQHEPIGEVYVVGVDPAARGRHLGTGLTLAGLRYLRGLGLRQVMLYVEADNAPAVKVYRDLGFTHWDSDVAYLR